MLFRSALILKECREDCRLESVASLLRKTVRRVNEILTAAGLGERVRFAPEAEAPEQSAADS